MVAETIKEDRFPHYPHGSLVAGGARRLDTPSALWTSAWLPPRHRRQLANPYPGDGPGGLRHPRYHRGSGPLERRGEKGGVMALPRGWPERRFHPVSGTRVLGAAASSGALTLDKLEAMTCVCSVGLDMIAIPGDTPETISAIIADEAAISMVNSKTAVRLIPAPGKLERFGALAVCWVLPLYSPSTPSPPRPLWTAAAASCSHAEPLTSFLERKLGKLSCKTAFCFVILLSAWEKQIQRQTAAWERRVPRRISFLPEIFFFFMIHRLMSTHQYAHDNNRRITVFPPSSGMPTKFIPYQPATRDSGRKMVVTMVRIFMIGFAGCQFPPGTAPAPEDSIPARSSWASSRSRPVRCSADAAAGKPHPKGNNPSGSSSGHGTSC